MNTRSLYFALLISATMSVLMHADNAQDQGPSFEEEVMRVEQQFSEVIQNKQESMAQHGHYIKGDVAHILALELLYRIAVKTDTISEKSWWTYALRGFEVWTGLSIVSEIAANLSDMKQLSNILAARQQFHNQVKSYQQSQNIFQSEDV